MKTLGLLAVLLFTSNSFGQGVWKEVATPYKRGITKVKGFTNGQVNILLNCYTVNSVGTEESNDTVAFSYDGGTTWEYIGIAYSSAGQFVIQNRITKFEFIDTARWYYCGHIKVFEQFTYHPQIFVNKYSEHDTSIVKLGEWNSQTIEETDASTMLFINDGSIYVLLDNDYNDSSALLRWDNLQRTWDTTLYTGSKHRIESIAANRDNGDMLFITGSYKYDKALFFKDSQTDSLIQIDTLGLYPLLNRKSFPEISHIGGSSWICTGSKYYSTTTNNGASWTTIDSLDGIIAAISFGSDGYGFITTNVKDTTSSIYKTTDHGTTWTKQISGIKPYIVDISIVDSLTAYFTNGKLFKTTGGGGSILLNTKDDNRQVSVNGISLYPNPVISNSCQLQYPSDPSTELIVVYDILGRTILSVLPSIGSDLTTLDLTQLPTGVYYITMGRERLKLIKN